MQLNCSTSLPAPRYHAGTIPASLAQFRKVQGLYLSGNKLIGKFLGKENALEAASIRKIVVGRHKLVSTVRPPNFLR